MENADVKISWQDNLFNRVFTTVFIPCLTTCDITKNEDGIQFTEMLENR